MSVLMNLLKSIDWLLKLLFVMAWHGALMMTIGFIGLVWTLLSLWWTSNPFITLFVGVLYSGFILIGLLQRISNCAWDIREELKRLNKPESLSAIGGWMTL